MAIITFILFIGIFAFIGILSIYKNKQNTVDYLIASHNVKPWLTALSAVATNNSGYMFIGMIGFTYLVGLQAIWLLIGWVSGDLLISSFTHKKIRQHVSLYKSTSYTSLLSEWPNREYTVVKILTAIVTITFLGVYAAAQLKAGSKALTVLFGWNPFVGAILGAVIVIAYCFAGGIRASIWTDVAQSLVMMTAMVLLFCGGLFAIGGPTNMLQQLQHITPTYLNLFPSNLIFGHITGPILFILGWIFAGIGVVGQPHIMLRFMALENVSKMNRTRCYYYLWYVAFYLVTFAVGLMTRLLMYHHSGFDAELALPLLSQQMFPAALVGLVLAGLFAATMSTADSQILCCTAAISHDLNLNKTNQYWLTKLITILFTVIILCIALFAHESVFKLVLIAWSALASTFAPLLIIRSLQQKITEVDAILIMLSGLFAMILWRWFNLNSQIYEALIGILAGFICFILLKILKIMHTWLQDKLVMCMK